MPSDGGTRAAGTDQSRAYPRGSEEGAEWEMIPGSNKDKKDVGQAI